MTPRHFPWSLRRDPSLSETLQEIQTLLVLGLLGSVAGIGALILFAFVLVWLA